MMYSTSLVHGFLKLKHTECIGKNVPFFALNLYTPVAIFSFELKTENREKTVTDSENNQAE